MRNNIKQRGQQTLFNAVFIRPEQVEQCSRGVCHTSREQFKNRVVQALPLVDFAKTQYTRDDEVLYFT